MTMLQFPWRPGDCTLTFGPGNSLQLLGTTAKLLLIMRGENTRLRGENQLPFQKLAPLLVLSSKKVRKKPHSEDAEDLWPGEADVDRPPSGCSVTLLTAAFLILSFPSFYSRRGSMHSVFDGDRGGASTVIGV